MDLWRSDGRDDLGGVRTIDTSTCLSMNDARTPSECLIPQGDQWAASFLASKPTYDRAAWIDAYAMAIGRLKLELSPVDAAEAAIEACAHVGHR